MEGIDAADRLDLIFIAAATELCPHADGAACPDCAVSIVARGWEAVATIERCRRPLPAVPAPATLVSPQPR